jgi:hypothetical protein
VIDAIVPDEPQRWMWVYASNGKKLTTGTASDADGDGIRFRSPWLEKIEDLLEWSGTEGLDDLDRHQLPGRMLPMYDDAVDRGQAQVTWAILDGEMAIVIDLVDAEDDSRWLTIFDEHGRFLDQGRVDDDGIRWGEY